ncbi:hypothetical protein GCM10011386_26910 [Parapedobacter defluvii]|uniref:DUF4133 domain-containing protein n=1 Tax=Parapedobacter defluvii TaxID=2045106 RepID=A0ABQ1M2Y6_9SPHI|nr:DUF4133 domain-containing protein [Parapedobacter defluvii]GGC33436.1 hypothetical protein GCM10011386_26910 [Parapedobacter defluvii]
MATVYNINKGINKPIEFRGLKGQYIGYLAGGLVGLLLLFAGLYLIGTSLYVCLPVVGTLGTALFIGVTSLSHRFGQHGLMKYFARQGMPRYLRFRSRRVFTTLKHKRNG